MERGVSDKLLGVGYANVGDCDVTLLDSPGGWRGHERM